MLPTDRARCAAVPLLAFIMSVAFAGAADTPTLVTRLDGGTGAYPFYLDGDAMSLAVEARGDAAVDVYAVLLAPGEVFYSVRTDLSFMQDTVTPLIRDMDLADGRMTVTIDRDLAGFPYGNYAWIVIIVPTGADVFDGANWLLWAERKCRYLEAAPSDDGDDGDGDGADDDIVTGTETLLAHEAAFCDTVTDLRSAEGLPALETDADLAAVARAHSADMLERGYMSSIDPDGATPEDRLDLAGIPWLRVVELVARAEDAPDPVDAIWSEFMDSEAHREALLDPLVLRSAVGTARRGTVVTFTWLAVLPDFAAEEAAEE